MFGLPSFLMTDAQRDAEKRYHERQVERRCPLAVDWTPDIKWQRELTIRGASYPVRSLFDVKPSGPSIGGAKTGQLALSPSGAFAYCEKHVPRGVTLQTIYGTTTGDVMFDAPVVVPALHELNTFTGRYEHLPWMSLTPMEMMTLRGGTRRAKGRVIVAGLGLGHQLIEVSKRRQVKKLTLVERSQELVDWLMPKIKPYLAQPVEIVVGDAYKVLPELSADVALVDIFRDYGGNEFRPRCPGIPVIWCWGGTEPVSARRAPIPYRLAARALRVAETIRRDHGDVQPADLLSALAESIQEEHGDASKARRELGQLTALENHTLRMALKALHEIATMSTDPAVVAKCRAVIGEPRKAVEP